jgi:hypothetical protein
MPDLSEQIENAASGPAEVSGDAGTVKQQPLSELMKADQYLKQNQAASKAHQGLRFNKLIPPGSV